MFPRGDHFHRVSSQPACTSGVRTRTKDVMCTRFICDQREKGPLVEINHTQKSVPPPSRPGGGDDGFMLFPLPPLHAVTAAANFARCTRQVTSSTADGRSTPAFHPATVSSSRSRRLKGLPMPSPSSRLMLSGDR